MSLELLAIDLGKRSFHLYGIDADGVIISRKVRRAKLADAVQNLAPTTVAMEACASAHHWGRLFIAAGRKVRLINPRFVKPFVKGSKNDATDAEAIFEAALRPNMRFVPVKSTGQQAIIASCARPPGLPAYRVDQSCAGVARRIWCCSAQGRPALRSASAGGSCTGRTVRPRPRDLCRLAEPTRQLQ